VYTTQHSIYRSIHAEVNAIRQFLRRHRPETLSKSTLIVIRLDRMDQLQCSRPCPRCTQVLEKYQLNKVFYS
jgi:deoxycytidylate deaminase